jgi:hypothetical protein
MEEALVICTRAPGASMGAICYHTCECNSLRRIHANNRILLPRQQAQAFGLRLCSYCRFRLKIEDSKRFGLKAAP